MAEPRQRSADADARKNAFQLGVLLAMELNRLALLVIGGERVSGHLPVPETIDALAKRALDALGFPNDKRESFEETLKFGRDMAPMIKELADVTQRQAELAGAANFMTLAGALAKSELAERHGSEAPYFMLLGETTIKILSQIKAWGTLFERSQADRIPEYFKPFQQDLLRARQGIGEDSSLPVFLLEVEQTPLKSPQDLDRLRGNFNLVSKIYFPEFDPRCFDRMALF